MGGHIDVAQKNVKYIDLAYQNAHFYGILMIEMICLRWEVFPNGQLSSAGQTPKATVRFVTIGSTWRLYGIDGP